MAPTVVFAAFLRSIVPTNPFAAAANDALLPLILFTAVFAVAPARLPAVQREPVTAFFDTIASAVLLIVGWVLALAPIGVLALAFGRSEEHTSELQSLMRISYAVFCLKKKKKRQTKCI